MTLHIGHRHTEQQNEVREARKLLKERVRDDWHWPVLPAHAEADSGRTRPDHTAVQAAREDNARSIGGFKFHALESAANRGELYFEPLEWRERTYSSAESDVDATIIDPKKKFRFEAPETVGKQLSERATARKRRRQQALAEEMEWNDGLAHWWRRRDAWCCAAPSSAPSDTLPSDPLTAHDTPSHQSGSNSETETVTTDSTPSPRSSTSTTATSLTSSTTANPAPSSSSSSSAADQPPPPLSVETLLPIAPLILPNHPIRTRISPSMYSEIYTKIILQSRTPSVPINLATLIAALVKGWKDDGEWPPKGAGAVAAEPLALLGKKARKKNRERDEAAGGGEGKESSLRTGVKAFGRVLRLGS